MTQTSSPDSAATLTTASQILADLVAFPTISSESNLDLMAYLSQRLTEAGAEIMLDKSPCNTKANLFATLGGDATATSGDNRRGIVFSGHTDVVPVEG